MLKITQSALFLLGILLLSTPVANAAGDERERVEMPEMMQEHMLSNMRDHLRTLEEIFAAMAEGKADKAAEIAEARIGMSSLGLHGAAHMAPFMPEPMQAMGTELHHAASRFVIAVQNAETESSADSQKAIFSALRDIGAACNACHSAYRLR